VDQPLRTSAKSSPALPSPALPSSGALDHSFFWPKSIAFVGASPDHDTIRGKLLMFAVKNGFQGPLYPVTRTHEEVDGYKAYPTVSAIGAPVDLAVVTIPAKFVVETVEDCARAGVPNVMIIASGFAEEGGAAAGVQDRLAEIGRRTGMRIAGPNCEGFYNALGSVAATFSPVVDDLKGAQVFEAAPDRRVGVVSQSGGLGFALLTRGRAAGLSFSYVISSGNEVDLSTAHYLEYMVEDPQTQIVMLLCEAIRDGARFVRAAQRASELGKPIVVIKIGATDAGARAAASHTASLTGSHTAYRAVFQRYGLIEAANLDEAVAITAVLATCPLPRGKRVGIVTASGGGGAVAADTFANAGLVVPELSEKVKGTIRPLIPPHASPLNPVDITAQGGRTGPVIMKCMEILAGSDDVDMVAVVISTAREHHVSVIADQVKAVVKAGTPVTFWTYTLPSLIGRKTIAEGGATLFQDLRLCAVAFRKLVDYAEHRAGLKVETVPPAKPLQISANLPLALSEHRVKALLAPYGIDASGERLVQSAAEAADAAATLGFPVVVKIQSPDILHKTEVGGVVVNLNDAQAVRAACNSILVSVKRHKPNAAIEGLLVQKMAPKGHELVIGMVNDPAFGPIMMTGFGGVTVELFGDVVHRPAPLGVEDAKAMIRSLKSARLLEGFRGAKPVDITPAAELIAMLSQVAASNRDSIQEMEFNPVILHADGSGLTIADALIVLKR
jgi:acyl-CoA synthetase (NDP forming)